MAVEDRPKQRQPDRLQRPLNSILTNLAVEVCLRMPAGEFLTDAGYTVSYSPERGEEQEFLPEMVTVRKGRSMVILERGGFQMPWELKEATGGKHRLTNAPLRNFMKAALREVRRYPVPR